MTANDGTHEFVHFFGPPTKLDLALPEGACLGALLRGERGDWLDGFETDADGQFVLRSYSEHPQPDGSIRIQALYKRKDGSFAEL